MVDQTGFPFSWHTIHKVTPPLVQTNAQYCWTFLSQIMVFYLPTKLLTDSISLNLIFYNIEKDEKLGFLIESPQRQITCNYSLYLLL